MDDLIIHSWCFHDVEYFDSTPSAAIIILDKDLESFSSLRSQHFSSLSSLPLVVTSVQEEIRSSGDCVDTARDRTLGWLKNSFK